MNNHSEPGRYDHDLVTFASGMVSMQASCAIRDAITLMADHARFACMTLTEIADAVVTRELEFC
jgi:hypothetical protein